MTKTLSFLSTLIFASLAIAVDSWKLVDQRKIQFPQSQYYDNTTMGDGKLVLSNTGICQSIPDQENIAQVFDLQSKVHLGTLKISRPDDDCVRVKVLAVQNGSVILAVSLRSSGGGRFGLIPLKLFQNGRVVDFATSFQELSGDTNLPDLTDPIYLTSKHVGTYVLAETRHGWLIQSFYRVLAQLGNEQRDIQVGFLWFGEIDRKKNSVQYLETLASSGTRPRLLAHRGLLGLENGAIDFGQEKIKVWNTHLHHWPYPDDDYFGTDGTLLYRIPQSDYYLTAGLTNDWNYRPVEKDFTNSYIELGKGYALYQAKREDKAVIRKMSDNSTRPLSISTYFAGLSSITNLFNDTFIYEDSDRKHHILNMETFADRPATTSEVELARGEFRNKNGSRPQNIFCDPSSAIQLRKQEFDFDVLSFAKPGAKVGEFGCQNNFGNIMDVSIW